MSGTETNPPTHRELAEAIARDLFTDVTGGHANRLVMEHGKEHLRGGGWSEPAVVDRIAMILTAKLQGVRTALEGVIRVADRDTVEFDAARAALSTLPKE